MINLLKIFGVEYNYRRNFMHRNNKLDKNRIKKYLNKIFVKLIRKLHKLMPIWRKKVMLCKRCWQETKNNNNKNHI